VKIKLRLYKGKMDFQASPQPSPKEREKNPSSEIISTVRKFSAGLKSKNFQNGFIR